MALVTGAGRGIGRAVAHALASEGAAVGLLARSGAELQAVAAEVEAAGGAALVLPADLAEDRAVDAAVRRLTAALGPPGILVNNAAVLQPAAPMRSIDPAAWAAALRLNVVAPVRLTLHVLPAMLEAGWGRIVNVSSGGVEVPDQNPGLNAYLSAKAALETHTLGIAAELRGTGVTANILRPGLVDTAMHAWVREQPPEEVGAALHAQFTGWRRDGLLQPPEVAAALLLELVVGAETGHIADAWTG